MYNPSTDTPPGRILVVDDNPDNLLLLTNMLSEHGYSVRPTTDSALAITSTQASPPDLILLDILMPGSDGYSVCKALKADERTREVPVIFISSLSEPFDKVQAFAAGGVDYITKPFDTEEVLARIATHLKLRRLQQQLEEQNAQLQREIAERRQAEAALHESQALLQALLDHSPVAIGVQDLQGRYIIVNRALLQGSGMTDAQQILGRTLEDIAEPATVRAAREQLQQIIVSGKPVALEYALPSTVGTRVLLSVGFPIRDASGALYAVGGIATDITSQKQLMGALDRQIVMNHLIMTISNRFVQIDLDQIDAEIQLALEEIGLHAAVDSASVTLYGSGPTVRIPYRWRRGGGTPPTITLQAEDYAWSRSIHRGGEIVSISDLADLPAEAGREQAILRDSGVRALLSAPLIAGQDVLGSLAFSMADGPRQWDESTISLVRIVSQTFANAIARQRAEAALRASEGRLAGILDIADDAIISVDASQRITLFNQGAERIFGYSAQEMLGRPLHLLLPEQSMASHARYLAEFATSPETSRRMGERQDVYGRREDGSEFPAEASISKLDLGGTHIFTVMLRDITERRRVEAALHESRALLRSIIDNAPMLITARDLQGRFTLVNRPTWEHMGFDHPQQMLGKTMAEVYAPDVSAQTDRQILDGAELVEREYTSDWHGQPHTRLWTSFPIYGAAGALQAIGAIAQDITEHRRTEHALESTNVMLLQRIDELSTLNSIAQLLSTVTDMPSALAAVCETSTRLFNTASVLIGTLDFEDSTLTVRAQFVRGAGIPNLAGQVIALSGETDAPRKTVEKRSVQRHPILDMLHDRLRLVAGCDLRLVTLRAHGQLIGVLAIFNSQPDRMLTPAEVSLAGTIAGQVAVAIENAWLFEHAQSAAVDAERHRLGRDLHDSVMQLLYSLTLLTDAWAARAAQGKLDDIAGRMRQLGSVSQQALREMRLLIFQLRPAALQDVGLIEALRRRLEMVEQRLGVATRFIAEGDHSNLSHLFEEQIFAITLEALNNILRHAGANQVDVRISLVADRITLTIRDDGHGFDLTNQPAGMGLSTMRERAEAIGGTLTINSTLWQGTTIEVTAPLENMVAREASPVLED